MPETIVPHDICDKCKHRAEDGTYKTTCEYCCHFYPDNFEKKE